MPERPREQEREEEEQREPDELDPARDPDRRRLGHAAIVALAARGAAAVKALPRALPWQRWPRRAPGKPRACVTAGGAPNAAHAVSFSSPCSGCSAVVTLLFTAFGSGGSSRRRRRSRSRPSRWPTRPPSGRGRRCWRRSATSASSYPSRRRRSPRSGSTGRTTARSRSSRSGGRRTPACSSGSGGASPGSGRDSPRWYQLEGGPAGNERARRRDAPGDGRLRAGQGVGGRRQRPRDRRQARRQPHRPAPVASRRR